LESGVGRWDEQYLSPYLFDEYLRLLDFDTAITPTGSLHDTLVAILQDPPAIDAASLAEHRRRYLLTGGFPELLLKDEPDAAHADLLLESQRTLGKDAVQRAVYQDIPQVYGIDNPMVLERLLYLLAGQLTGILSPKSICSELDGLSQPTFDKYLGYLEHSFIVFTLQNYAATEAGKQKRGRKLYFIDGAVRNAALQRGLGPLTDTAEMGLLIENLVAAHLHALGQQAQVRVHYWRRGGDEVDFIYDHPTAPLAFEVGMSASHSRKGLQALKQAFPKFNHRCFVVSPDANLKSPESAFDGIGTLPIDLLLVAISSQAAQNLQHQLGVTELDGKPNLFAQ
jgi:predicted AAA+ superfamily ATPase